MIVAMIYLSVFLWLSQIWLFVRLKHGSEIFLVQNAVVGCCDLFIFILCFHSPCVIPPVVGTWRDIFLHFSIFRLSFERSNFKEFNQKSGS